MKKLSENTPEPCTFLWPYPLVVPVFCEAILNVDHVAVPARAVREPVVAENTLLSSEYKKIIKLYYLIRKRYKTSFIGMS